MTMPNYLERISAAGARTRPEVKPVMAIPPRIPGAMLGSVLHLDRETFAEQPAVDQSDQRPTNLPFEGKAFSVQETPHIQRKTSNPSRTASAASDPMPQSDSLPVDAYRRQSIFAESQPAVSSADEALQITSSATESPERDRRKTGNASRRDGKAPHSEEVFSSGRSSPKTDRPAEMPKELKTSESRVSKLAGHPDSTVLPTSSTAFQVTPAPTPAPMARQEEQGSRVQEAARLIKMPKELKTSESRVTKSPGHPGPTFLSPSGTVSGVASASIPTSISGEEAQGDRVREAARVIEMPKDTGQIAHPSLPVSLAQPSVTLHPRKEASSIDLPEPSQPKLHKGTTRAQPAAAVPMKRLENSLRESQNRITIGRIEVHLNNVSRPVESQARAEITSPFGQNFLEEQYLNRFPMRP
jgi:hypothetical protein